MQQAILLSGFGGQGVMFAGQLLAYSAMDEGYHVTWIPSYGPEMRGGTAHCTVVISDKPIGSPIVKHPDNIIVFNKPSFDKYEPLVACGGLLITNKSLVESVSTRLDIDELAIPATQIADALGNLKLTNMVLIGAMLAHRPIITVDALINGLNVHIPAHRRDMIAINVEAIERGVSFVHTPM